MAEKVRGLDNKVWGKVFDKPTLLALNRLFNRGIFNSLQGEISSGKEAKIFVALNDKPLVAKIYRVDAAAFETVWKYLKGDPRYGNISKNRRSVIELWTKKEFGNLSRLYAAGVRVPRPYAFMRNVLVMGYLGAGVPAPQLKKLAKSERTNEIFEDIITQVSRAYQVAHLVHADLSEYNLLFWDQRPYIIDVGQAVDTRHPKADDFLRRDLTNIVNFFNKDLKSVGGLMERVKGE